MDVAGLLAIAGGLVAIDFALAIDPLWSLVLTGLEMVFVVPWAHLLLRLERDELRMRASERGRRLRLLAAHTATFTLLALALIAKVQVLHRATLLDTERFVSPYRSYAAALFVLIAIGLIGRGSRFGRFLATVAEHPARLMALSFGLSGLIGGFLLTLPVSLQRVREASFVDGLFTSVSAVCVTGLTVNDIASTYTRFGQTVILVLIQIGGIGIMVLSSFFAIVAGRRLRARSSVVLAEMIDAESLANLRRTVLTIVLYTLTLEAIGAVALYIAFGSHPEVVLGPDSTHLIAGAGGRVWASVFHSVSAFCNAGFSLFHGNLLGFAGSWSVCLLISALIVVGGLGFPVLDEMVRRARTRIAGRRPPRVSLHSRVVLVTSAALVVVLTVSILALEWNRTLAGMPVHERFLASLFQSVTTRTAGFNTVDVGALATPTLLLVTFAMFIGGSPGSTAGGIKTTTFAVLMSSFRAELRGHASAQLLDRALTQSVMRRAFGVAVASAMIVAGVAFVLLLAEPHRGIALAFETVSAFATCGLSMGITAKLSALGKIVIMLTMFVGRIGPLTLAVALATRARTGGVALPEERLMIG